MTDPADGTDPVDPILTELRGLRTDMRAVGDKVSDERRGRRLSIRLTGAAGLAIVLVIGGFVVKWRFDDARYSRTTCAERVERSEQIRRGIVGVAPAVVDALAQEFSTLSPDQKARANAVATKAARESVDEDIPPPDC